MNLSKSSRISTPIKIALLTRRVLFFFIENAEGTTDDGNDIKMEIKKGEDDGSTLERPGKKRVYQWADDDDIPDGTYFTLF